MFLFLLSLVALAAAACLDKNAMLGVVATYQAAQNALDAKATAAIFARNATLFMPVGGNLPPFVGRPAILAAYSQYFGSLTSNNETVMTPQVVSGNIIAYGKNIDVTQVSGMSFSAYVVSWFAFACDASGKLVVSSLSHAYDN